MDKLTVTIKVAPDAIFAQSCPNESFAGKVTPGRLQENGVIPGQRQPPF